MTDKACPRGRIALTLGSDGTEDHSASNADMLLSSVFVHRVDLVGD